MNKLSSTLSKEPFRMSRVYHIEPTVVRFYDFEFRLCQALEHYKDECDSCQYRFRCLTTERERL
jgi:hypothetical protein